MKHYKFIEENDFTLRNLVGVPTRFILGTNFGFLVLVRLRPKIGLVAEK